ncbi:general transcription factor IIH subunit 3 isoform X2 [Diachasmimorpha longicaudata]|uniref:general transcription factor IIH subunit 3 isoform X2 n=1 Tax=Diachasmimorpha longicaudata TaxID=58733 RepID=UPI0030B8A476
MGTTALERSLLLIILDVNPVQRIVKQEAKILTQCIDSVIVFANSHLMQSATNDLGLIACHGQGAKFLYPETDKSVEVRQFDGQYEKFTLVERTVRQTLQGVINELINTRPLNSESLISGALSLALCYIARLEREKSPGEKLHSRILVVTGSNDSATQYMNYMNVFFTAQKMVKILKKCVDHLFLSLLRPSVHAVFSHLLANEKTFLLQRMRFFTQALPFSGLEVNVVERKTKIKSVHLLFGSKNTERRLFGRVLSSMFAALIKN